MANGKVLIVGDDSRSFLTIVRSLGRRGISVHVAPFDFTAVALKSRYISRIHNLPHHLGDGSAWKTAYRELLDAEAFDLVVPVDERSLLPFDAHRNHFAADHKIAIPSRKAIDVLYDKHLTRELAISLDIPVAAGRPADSSDDAKAIAEEYGFPIAIKPRRSYSLEQLHARGGVVIGYDSDTLCKALKNSAPGGKIVEAFFCGEGIGVSVLANQGRLLQVFQHKREHKPSELGGSSYRVSVAVEPAFETACFSIVDSVGYTGVAMFEFIKDSTSGRWILLEVNARPWGSLPLPVAAGVDFPYYWYRLLVEGEEEPRAQYRVGLFGRNSTADFYYLSRNLHKRRNDFAGAISLLIGYGANILRWPMGREANDTLVRDDPRPGVGELRNIFTSICKGVAKRMSLTIPGARRRAISAAERSFVGHANVDLRLTFLCQGNICRSPFAESVFLQNCPDSLLTIEVDSAGMLPVIGRSSPELAICVARQFGAELNKHRSRYLDLESASSATLLIVFDEITSRAFHRRYPDLKTPVVALGDLLDRRTAISDPYGGDAQTFENCYRQIVEGVDNLIGIIERAMNGQNR